MVKISFFLWQTEILLTNIIAFINLLIDNFMQSKILQEGFLEPPPILTEKISKWISSIYAIYIKKSAIKKIFELKQELLIDPDNQNFINQKIDVYKKLSAELSVFITEKTLVDLSRQKYKKEFKISQYDWSIDPDEDAELPKSLVVSFELKDISDGIQYGSLARWRGFNPTLDPEFGNASLVVNGISNLPNDISKFKAILNKILNTVEHELVHVTQSVMRIITKAPQAGLPSKDISHLGPEREETIGAIKKTEHHSRDIEFYPRFYESYKEFSKFLSRIPDEPEKIKENVFKYYVGMNLDSKDIIKQSLLKAGLNRYDFFWKLRDSNIEKWKKAVKEFYKKCF